MPATALALDASREEVLAHVTRLLGEAWLSFDQSRPYQPPLDDELRSLLQTPLPEQGTPVARALEEAARILDESLAPPRPRYFGFVPSAGLEIGVVADALASCHDVNLAVYAAAAGEVERQAIDWLAAFIGFPAGAGATTSGGTLSNLTALAAARERALPGSRREGLADRRPTIYCSDEAHYSVTRAAELMGFGSKFVRGIPIDERRRMRPEAAAAAIDDDRREGAVPVAVIASAGTTLTGAIDPIDALADVCADREVWLHVDGAYGAPAAATALAGPLFRGLDRADSVAIDAHKWLFLPKACSVVLVRDRAVLPAAFAHHEHYLPDEDDRPNPVDTTLEYSRPFRALKLWLAFRTHGAAAFRQAITRNLEQARLLAEEVRGHADLELLIDEPPLSIVPFRHLPSDGRDVDEHNRALARLLQDEGRVFVSPADIDGHVALRPCIVNYRTTDDDVRALVAIVRETATFLLRRSA